LAHRAVIDRASQRGALGHKEYGRYSDDRG